MNILFAGDICIDLFINQNARLIGGCSFNCSIHARQLFSKEHKISLLAPAPKKYIKILNNFLALQGITPILVECPGELSSQQIFVEKDGERTFGKFKGEQLDSFTPSPDLLNKVSEFDLVVVPLFSQTISLYNKIKDHTNTLVLDLCSGEDLANTDTKQIIKGSQIIFMGAKNLLDPIVDDIQKFSNEGIVTLGAKGSQSFQKGIEIARVNSKPVEKITDTTGAGDSYIASYLFNRFEKKLSIEKSQAAAHEYAKETIKYLGGSKVARDFLF